MKVYIHKTKLGLRIAVFRFVQLLSLAIIALGVYSCGEELFTGLFIIATGAFLLLAMMHTLKSVKFGNWDEPVIEITVNGFWDRRVFVRPVPWAKLDWRFYTVKGNPSIGIHINGRDEDYVPSPDFVDKFAYKMAAMLGFYKYHIDLMSLKTKAEDIRLECEKYKPSA